MKFEDMKLSRELIENLKNQNILTPTKIQEEVIPSILEGKDIIAQSETGSGKTLGFAVPLIEMIFPKDHIQALIIVPTRELAKQITEEFEKFSRFKHLKILTVYGGSSINVQIKNLERTNIVVGTPGRILDLLERRELVLKQIKFLVLDEADRMLDMGFIDDIKKIMSQTPKYKQTMLFSATLPSPIVNLARNYQNNPKHVKLAAHVKHELLTQFYYVVKQNEKISLLYHLIKTDEVTSAIVFCKTKRTTDFVARELYKQRIQSKCLNGNMSQNKREETINQFKEGKLHILVATDVAARGLHIEDVSHIFNFDIPETVDTYTHRIGRTARSGKTGKAIALVSEHDYDNFRRVQEHFSDKLKRLDLPIFEKIKIEFRPQFQKRRFSQNRSFHKRRYN